MHNDVAIIFFGAITSQIENNKKYYLGNMLLWKLIHKLFFNDILYT